MQTCQSSYVNLWDDPLTPCSFPWREPSRVIDEEEETYILIHSLQDANMPKFLSEDVPLFESIMADLFPGIEPPPQNYTTLEVSRCHLTTRVICDLLYSQQVSFY